MATISFTVNTTMCHPPDKVWDAVIDWPSHSSWVPLTTVETDPDNPDSFTAWSGFGHQGWGRRFCLEDKMLATEKEFSDNAGGFCRVSKCGPLLFGDVDVIVSPDEHDDRIAHVTWSETVECRWVPKVFAPLFARGAQSAFRRSLRKLNAWL